MLRGCSNFDWSSLGGGVRISFLEGGAADRLFPLDLAARWAGSWGPKVGALVGGGVATGRLGTAGMGSCLNTVLGGLPLMGA